MAKFPVDAPKRRVVKALKILGFQPVREKEHISMVRENPSCPMLIERTHIVV